MAKEIHIKDIMFAINIAFKQELGKILEAIIASESCVVRMQRARDMMFVALKSFNRNGE